MSEEIIYGSEDFLQDLGATPEEAMKMRLRYDLASEIEDTIIANKWTQMEAAKRLRIPQSRVSYLLRGKIEKFTLDALIEIYARIGGKISVTREKTNNAA